MIIERKEYLNKLITWKDKQLIKIVTGVRRCGKSVLLKMYQDYLKNNGVKESQIVTINFEDLDYEELTNFVQFEANQKKMLINLEDKKISEAQDKLQTIKEEVEKQTEEYLSKQRQISTFLECKKTFLGKVKYYFSNLVLSS